jgi:hypothetical protein
VEIDQRREETGIGIAGDCELDAASLFVAVPQIALQMLRQGIETDG